jgi:hypothetical protein
MVHILNIIHPKNGRNIDVNRVLNELEIESREPKDPMVTYSRDSRMNSSVHILPDIDNPKVWREEIKEKIDDCYNLEEKTVIEIIEFQ